MINSCTWFEGVRAVAVHEAEAVWRSTVRKQYTHLQDITMTYFKIG